MTPHEFIRKWSISALKERSGSQEHFIDLCRMLGQRTPADADPEGKWYSFEKGATKYGGGGGWADVWMKGHFAWEYKGQHKDLDAAYDQLLRYRESLQNPPLLVVSDMQRFKIHTNFTGTAKHIYEFTLADLAKEENLRIFQWMFTEPERLKPETRVEEVTEGAAREFATLADALRSRGVDPRRAAHFLNRLLFCLFAEDVGLLPRRLFQRVIEAGARDPAELANMLRDLFHAMTHGGRFGVESIHYFDGSLFTDAEVIPLQPSEIEILRRAAGYNWGQIEPAIFGTLFERCLDPSKRSQLGAHYTDRGSILRVVEPVLMRPLRSQWAVTREKVEAVLARLPRTSNKAAASRLRKKARRLIADFRTKHLDSTRVLDPACGSGNFLYVALEQLHELEKEVLLLLERLEVGQFSLDVRVSPHMVQGIEINAFAQELAQVTVWIGHLQWFLRNGFSFETHPVLKPIQSIECRDAILDLADPASPKEAKWPKADVVVGNPPFLGGKKLRNVLGDDYVDTMFKVYDDRVPREADLVTYWFEKARAAIGSGRLKRAGLLATNSIRGGASRKVLQRIRESGQIFMAWSDEPWIVEGAAVRISLVGFDGGTETEHALDGRPVPLIFADLTAPAGASAGMDLTRARRLKENLGIAFMGDTKGGPFEIPGALAQEWLKLPANPNGRTNADVLRPWVNGLDITRRPRGMWIIDFGVDLSEREAALYEAPFQYVLEKVKPIRVKSRTTTAAWWLHERPRPEMRQALAKVRHTLATPTVAKHRLFMWLPAGVLPDHQLIVFARNDDYFFGVLHSRFHEVWALRLGTSLEDRPRYTPTTTFETFPLPHPTDEQRARIRSAVVELDRARRTWLEPAGATPTGLGSRTFTNLYNQRPAWLINAHAELDAAVAAAYGWPADLLKEDILARLLTLNLERQPA